MANPSFPFHHSLRCSKNRQTAIPVSIPTESRLVVSTLVASSASLSHSFSYTPSASSSVLSTSTPLVRSSPPRDSQTLGKIHPTIPLLTADNEPTDHALTSASTATSEPTNTKTDATFATKSTSPSSGSILYKASQQASTTPTGASSSPESSSTGLPGQEATSQFKNNDRPRVVIGGIFGALGFIALVALLCILLLRRKRRIHGDNKSTTTLNWKLSRIGRNSAPTLTSWQPRQSGFSFHASTPSPRSQSIHTFMTPEPFTPPKPVLFNNPFTKSGEFLAEPQIGTGLVQNPFLTPERSRENSRKSHPSKLSPTELQPIPRGKPEALVIPRSVYGSDHSLGSTIVLPGRESSVGSFQMLSYRISSPAALTPRPTLSPGSALSPRPVDPKGKRVSTRSDPFDLEMPPAPDAAHLRA